MEMKSEKSERVVDISYQQNLHKIQQKFQIISKTL